MGKLNVDIRIQGQDWESYTETSSSAVEFFHDPSYELQISGGFDGVINSIQFSTGDVPEGIDKAAAVGKSSSIRV